MSFVKDDHCIFVVNVEVFADFLINKVVVGHEHEVSTCDAVLGDVVRTVLVSESVFVDLLDISGRP